MLTFCLLRGSPQNYLSIMATLPPFGVFLQEGLGKHFWINILLTLLGYIPGLVHSVWIVARK